MGVNQQSNQEIVMKRNESKSVVSVIAAAVIALLAAGCVTVPSGDFAEGQESYLPVDRGTGS
jgi:hypothetical protein